MADIRKIISQLAAQEGELLDTQFLAPCVRGGRVRTKIGGMIYTFQLQQRKFEGWAILEPINDKIAAVVEEPSLPQVAEYLQLLVPIRLQLARVLQGQTWLAYPVNESDAKQRVGFAKPVAVHLVSESSQFEQIVARWDGNCLWFEEIDRRADPLLCEELKDALKKLILPQEVRFKGMTPEMRIVYELVCRNIKDFAPKVRDEQRLQRALQMGGGELRDFSDRADYWLVEWTSASGEHHSSAIAKNDLTVMSSGICLSGLDKDFDLQSLVGVVEDR
ncbi:MAG: hypothetical protein EAZ25_29370 [Oscillatoriales cyanobacterium]|nr:MAG: hypothetical protein EAZ94_25215 [Oscillatoriales cyanobacterium]TAE18202.1 MAG: hypothetical protein EAZ93_29835 [Oscillatoriales cyanobacterium]TAG61910.1 MAG: hypothetical protein EAZ25_29370 [Oscillatoriales cyanobacterium]